MRYAIVQGSPAATVAAYLPSNYEVVGAYWSPTDQINVVFIAGHDHAGWTLDDYVIPRLASGLHACTELREVTP